MKKVIISLILLGMLNSKVVASVAVNLGLNESISLINLERYGELTNTFDYEAMTQGYLKFHNSILKGFSGYSGISVGFSVRGHEYNDIIEWGHNFGIFGGYFYTFSDFFSLYLESRINRVNIKRKFTTVTGLLLPGDFTSVTESNSVLLESGSRFHVGRLNFLVGGYFGYDLSKYTLNGQIVYKNEYNLNLIFGLSIKVEYHIGNIF